MTLLLFQLETKDISYQEEDYVLLLYIIEAKIFGKKFKLIISNLLVNHHQQFLMIIKSCSLEELDSFNLVYHLLLIKFKSLILKPKIIQ